MPDPFVSAVIPTYNRTHELVRAVESVLGQDYPAERLEIIIVDDGSRDPDAVERALAPHRSRLTLLRKPNGGASSARNHGARHARGELLAFLDSDDEWLPHKIRRQVEFLASRPTCALVTTDVIRIDDVDGEVCTSRREREFLPSHGVAEALRAGSLPPSTVLVRRDVFDALGGFDTSLRTAEDLDFHLRAAHRFALGIVSEPLIRVHACAGPGLSNSPSTYRDRMAVVSRHVQLHAAALGPRVRHEILLHHHAQNARGLILGGRYREAAGFAVRGVRHVRGPSDARTYAGLVLTLARHVAGRMLRPLRGARTARGAAP
jgi:glycosyltransferase involved in cell wall biosynthesis